jgi:phosphoribosyl-AMP cyclohydrolase/phosphoribosyl-ATP pyrophosphohydrolase/phosphoribosyl-AMP cyclohydrolase
MELLFFKEYKMPETQTENTIKLPELEYDERGLIPCVVQDATSGDVLMMAWMNKESIELTLKTKQTWFWSRSRSELWNKGATSGNTQELIELFYDCDADTLLAKVNPAGPACHTGAKTCFYRKLN